MKRSKATPVRLAGLSIFGSLIAASAFLVIPAASHYSNGYNGGFFGSSFIARLIAMLAFLCGGWYLSIWSQQELSNGIQLDRWTEEQLHPILAFSDSRISKIALVVLAIIGIVFYLREIPFLHHSGSSGFWICFVLCNGLMSLKRSLAPPNDSQLRPWLETSAPLQSDHWGK